MDDTPQGSQQKKQDYKIQYNRRRTEERYRRRGLTGQALAERMTQYDENVARRQQPPEQRHEEDLALRRHNARLERFFEKNPGATRQQAEDHMAQYADKQETPEQEIERLATQRRAKAKERYAKSHPKVADPIASHTNIFRVQDDNQKRKDREAVERQRRNEAKKSFIKGFQKRNGAKPSREQVNEHMKGYGERPNTKRRREDSDREQSDQEPSVAGPSRPRQQQPGPPTYSQQQQLQPGP
jgi:hypothetical protein